MTSRKSRPDTAKGPVEEMRRILTERTPEAVSFLVEVMRDESQKAELRMKAAESILDRACGKATAAQSAEPDTPPPTTVLFEGVLEEWSR